MRKEVINWFRQSKADLKTARNCFKSKDYYASAFFAHQSIEKALKALHIHLKKELPPKTHSLIELGKALKVKKNLMPILKEMSPEYILTRYPNAAYGVPAELYTKEKALKCIKNAEKVVKWVEKRLKIE